MHGSIDEKHFSSQSNKKLSLNYTLSFTSAIFFSVHITFLEQEFKMLGDDGLDVFLVT